MKNSQIPVARREGLVVQETADEVLVYDLTTNKAHCLNETAAIIWKSCDGSNTISDIGKLLESSAGSTVNEDLIWLAIDQLNEKNLLEKEITPKFAGRSRRDVIKKIGLATVVALPIVASLTAPTSALASTSCACVVPGDCFGTSCPSTTNCNTGAGGVCIP